MSKPMQRWLTFAVPAIIIALGLTMLVLSWRRWPDPLVDFGRELYVPWQLSRGQVLYRDIAYFNGPLSPYFNALVFRTCGVGLMSLAWVNIAILTVFTFLAYRLLKFISSHFAATFACAVFLIMFALGQYTNTGNYNFICPYSHELTHGLLLSFTAVHLLSRYLAKPRAIFIGLAGLCLGLILLTKPEVFLASAGALIVGLILILLREKPALARFLKLLLLFIAGLVIPSACFVLYFISQHMSCGQAVRSVFLGYVQLCNQDLIAQKFYLGVSGLDEPEHNLLRALAVFAWHALLLGPLVLAELLLRRFGKQRRYIQPFVFFLGLGAGLLLFFKADWYYCLLALPLFVVITGIGLLVSILRRTSDKLGYGRLAIGLVLTAFSLLLLSKIALNVRVYQYGFALAAPAGMIFVVFLLDILPRWIAGESSGGWVFKTAIAGVLIVALSWHFETIRKNYSRKTEQIAEGCDAFYVDPQRKGRAVKQAYEALLEYTPPQATFVVLPEGVMLNYLTRRPNPTKYISFMPPELTIFGQEQMLSALRANRPDVVLQVPRGLREYGYQGLGIDYANELSRWIRINYWDKDIIGQSRRVTPEKVHIYDVYLRWPTRP